MAIRQTESDLVLLFRSSPIISINYNSINSNIIYSGVVFGVMINSSHEKISNFIPFNVNKRTHHSQIKFINISEKVKNVGSEILSGFELPDFF